MRTALELLVAASIALTLWFVAELGLPSRSADPPTSRLLWAWAWATIVFEALLLLALFRVPVPWWLAVLAVAAQDVIWVWRLVALRRARAIDEPSGGTTPPDRKGVTE